MMISCFNRFLTNLNKQIFRMQILIIISNVLVLINIIRHITLDLIMDMFLDIDYQKMINQNQKYYLQKTNLSFVFSL